MAAGNAVMAAGVIVRATGTRWPLSVPDWPLTESGLAEAVLVDFDDRYHPTAARNAKSREQSYDEAGMTVWTAAANKMGTAETTGTP
jgi:hypothetical protein